MLFFAVISKGKIIRAIILYIHSPGIILYKYLNKWSINRFTEKPKENIENEYFGHITLDGRKWLN